MTTSANLNLTLNQTDPSTRTAGPGFAQNVDDSILKIDDVSPVSVKALGTLGLGNDAALLQSALTKAAAAGASGLVYAGRGTYDCSTTQITWAAGVKLFGGGRATTVIQTALTSGDFLQWASTASGMGASSFTLKQTGTGGSQGINTNQASDFDIADMRFDGPFHQQLLLYKGAYGRVSSCHFTAAGVAGNALPGDCISVFQADHMTISTCTFADFNQDAVYFATCTNSTLDNPIISGGPEGVQIRDGCDNCWVRGGTITVKGSNAIGTITTVSGHTVSSASFGVIVQTNATHCGVDGTTFKVDGTGTAVPAFAVGFDTGCNRSKALNIDVQAGFIDGVSVNTSGGGAASDWVKVTGQVTGTIRYGIFYGSGHDNGTIEADVDATGDRGILYEGDFGRIKATVLNCGFHGLDLRGNYGEVSGIYSLNVVTGSNGVYVTGQGNKISCNAKGNAKYGIGEDTGADDNTIVGFNCLLNGDGTEDVHRVGANTKVADGNGRYTPHLND